MLYERSPTPRSCSPLYPICCWIHTLPDIQKAVRCGFCVWSFSFIPMVRVSRIDNCIPRHAKIRRILWFHKMTYGLLSLLWRRLAMIRDLQKFKNNFLPYFRFILGFVNEWSYSMIGMGTGGNWLSRLIKCVPLENGFHQRMKRMRRTEGVCFGEWIQPVLENHTREKPRAKALQMLCTTCWSGPYGILL